MFCADVYGATPSSKILNYSATCEYGSGLCLLKVLGYMIIVVCAMLALHEWIKLAGVKLKLPCIFCF